MPKKCGLLAVSHTVPI